ncbi:MAG: plastocyanin/azurin family copper-binding protein [Acidobacteriota bacterium]
MKTQKQLPTFARSLALVGAMLALAAAPALAAPRVIKLTGTDAMKYNVAQINAKPGEELTIQLSGVSTQDKVVMAHNFVLVAQGTDVNAFVVAASVARPTHIPKQEKWKKAILASTGLAGGGETVTVTFKAPTTPGAYTYVCTFPGHYNGGMKGVLTVK